MSLDKLLNEMITQKSIDKSHNIVQEETHIEDPKPHTSSMNNSVASVESIIPEIHFDQALN